LELLLADKNVRSEEHRNTVNLGKSGFDLTDDFIRFRRRSGLCEGGCL